MTRVASSTVEGGSGVQQSLRERVRRGTSGGQLPSSVTESGPMAAKIAVRQAIPQHPPPVFQARSSPSG